MGRKSEAVFDGTTLRWHTISHKTMQEMKSTWEIWAKSIRKNQSKPNKQSWKIVIKLLYFIVCHEQCKKKGRGFQQQEEK